MNCEHDTISANNQVDTIAQGRLLKKKPLHQIRVTLFSRKWGAGLLQGSKEEKRGVLSRSQYPGEISLHTFSRCFQKKKHSINLVSLLMFGPDGNCTVLTLDVIPFCVQKFVDRQLNSDLAYPYIADHICCTLQKRSMDAILPL